MNIAQKIVRKISQIVSPKPDLLSIQNMLRIQKKHDVNKPPNLYGMLMMRGDLDVLEEVLRCNAPYFRAIFVLDGTEQADESKKILDKFPTIESVIHDRDLPEEYNRPPRDGARQVLLEAIQKKFGYDGYIAVLHSDEMFFDYPPSLLVGAMKHFDIDSVSVNNVHFFLHSSIKNQYNYETSKSVVSQIQYASFPGYREMRLFKNKPGLYYHPNEHSRVVPHGLKGSVKTLFPIRHYLYRSPDQMVSGASDRAKRDWQKYGSGWMEKSDERFVDCLEGYAFAKRIPPGSRIINGETGELDFFLEDAT